MSAGLFIFWLAVSSIGAFVFLSFVVDNIAVMTNSIALERKKLGV